MNKLIPIIISLMMFSNTSCRQNDDVQVAENNTADNLYRVVNIDEYIAPNAGKYIETYIPTDFVVEVSAHKATPLDKELVAARMDQYIDCRTKINPNVESPFTCDINGFNVGSTPKITKSNIKTLQNIYGETAEFNFTSTTKSVGSDTVVKLYIPEYVQITSPKVTNDEDFLPSCYYKNFILRWNADKNNKNGVLISVEWLGTALYGSDDNRSYVRRTDFIAEDDGETVLNEKLFDDIPDTGVVYITILRGNIENVVVGEYSYKLSGETHAVLPLILIRNLKTKSS